MDNEEKFLSPKNVEALFFYFGIAVVFWIIVALFCYWSYIGFECGIFYFKPI